MPSTPMVTGAVQLPPDGNPIILLPDHATVGGYPVIACVISCRPPRRRPAPAGRHRRVRQVDRASARGAWARRERALAERVTGWFPTEAAT